MILTPELKKLQVLEQRSQKLMQTSRQLTQASKALQAEGKQLINHRRLLSFKQMQVLDDSQLRSNSENGSRVSLNG